MEFSTIIGIISSFVTIEEAASGGIRKCLEKPHKPNIDRISSTDEEVNYYIDKFKSLVLESNLKCITDDEIKQIKKMYYSGSLIPMLQKREVDKKIDAIIEELNNYIKENVDIGTRLVFEKQRNQNEKLNKIHSKLDDIQDALESKSIANSTIEFKEKYNENLFWDDENSDIQIRLSDVYVNPRTNTDTDVISEIDEFLNDSTRTVMFIEAVAGSGKSSLMYRLGNNYCDSKHYFLKLSILDMESGGGSLISALSDYSKRDKAWENYYQKGNVVFLDGFDEISGKIRNDIFEKNIREFKQKKIKLIITTRPKYLNVFKSDFEKIIMVPLSKCQIKEWIHKYAEKKNLRKEEYSGYLAVLEDDKKYTTLKDIISIPIFLYIIFNKHINIDEIETQTQLFNNVIEQLKEDKIEVGQYDMHNQIAKCMGFYLQAHMWGELDMEYIPVFLKFCNSALEEKITLEKLSQAFASMFIKNISEGEKIKEFYHKSIRDYFSASYIYDTLRKIVLQINKNEEMENLGALYTSLIDKHNIKEEMAHLSFFINNDKSIDKEKWVRSLQDVFEQIVDNGITPDTEEWFIDRFSKHDGKISVHNISARYRYICDNHIMIMQDIFEEKICNMGNNFIPFARFVINDIMLVGDSNKAQFIWKLFYGQTITVKDLIAVNDNDIESVFETMTKDDGTARQISLYCGNVKIKSSYKVRGRFESCKLSNIYIEASTFHEIGITNTSVDSFEIIRGKIEYMTMENSSVRDSSIFAYINSSYITKSNMMNCRIGNKKAQNPMKITGANFKDVEFDGVAFLYVECDERTVFENVIFKNCEFYSNVGKEVIMMNCSMDISSYNEFKKYNLELINKYGVEIL